MKSPSSTTVGDSRGVAPDCGTIHYAALAALPGECRFAEDLARRMWYEADERRLAFRGFMSKATFDRLEGLSKDPAYQRALEELFRESVFELPPESAGRSRLVWIALVVAVGAVVLGLGALLARLW
ncbi:MAG: hypothetical protein J5I93_18515 [Pirellulaceae bacterium]|nr:hypothetical protein [Pirellulaceae bacterium]